MTLLLYSPTGLEAGAGPGLRLPWSWWARSTQGRRVEVQTRAEAFAGARGAAPGCREVPTSNKPRQYGLFSGQPE